MTNEFNAIIENSLGGLGAGRTIAAVRVVDDTGGSANASPSQLRELVGVDHSILTEQIVPGEFWVDPDGVRRQVYTRTMIVKGTTVSSPHSVVGFVVFPNKKNLVSISGVYSISDAQYLIGVDYTPSLKKLDIDSLIEQDRIWYNLYCSVAGEAFTIVATIKYTK